MIGWTISDRTAFNILVYLVAPFQSLITLFGLAVMAFAALKGNAKSVRDWSWVVLAFSGGSAATVLMVYPEYADRLVLLWGSVNGAVFSVACTLLARSQTTFGRIPVTAFLALTIGFPTMLNAWTWYRFLPHESIEAKPLENGPGYLGKITACERFQCERAKLAFVAKNGVRVALESDSTALYYPGNVGAATNWLLVRGRGITHVIDGTTGQRHYVTSGAAFWCRPGELITVNRIIHVCKAGNSSETHVHRIPLRLGEDGEFDDGQWIVGAEAETAINGCVEREQARKHLFR